MRPDGRGSLQERGGEEKKESFIPGVCTDPWGLGNKTAGSEQRLRGDRGSQAAKGTPREGGEPGDAPLDK